MIFSPRRIISPIPQKNNCRNRITPAQLVNRRLLPTQQHLHLFSNHCACTAPLTFIPHNSPHQSVVISKQHPLQNRQIHRPTDSPHCAIAEYDHAIFKGEKMPSKYKPHCPPIKISPPPNLSIDAYCQHSSICTCSVTHALVQHPSPLYPTIRPIKAW